MDLRVSPIAGCSSPIADPWKPRVLGSTLLLTSKASPTILLSKSPIPEPMALLSPFKIAVSTLWVRRAAALVMDRTHQTARQASGRALPLNLTSTATQVNQATPPACTPTAPRQRSHSWILSLLASTFTAATLLVFTWFMTEPH